MRKLSLLLFGFCFITCAPLSIVQINQVSRDIQLSEQKDKLYVRANNWLVENFDSAKSVVQFRDKEEGIITGRYLLKTLGEYTTYGDSRNYVYSIIKLQVKDGAARITIDPEDYETNTSKFSKEQYVYDKDQATIEINELITGFEYYMKNHIDSF